MFNESAFETANAEAHRIQDQSGFPPALDDPRLKAREILFWLDIDDDGPLDDLIEMQGADDHVRRAVVGATLHILMNDNPAEGAYDTLRDAFGRFVESVAVPELADPALLRWELHVAAAAGSLERVLEIGRRLESLGPTADLRALLANTMFLLVHPSSRSLEIFATPSAFDPVIHAPQWNLVDFCDLFTHMLASTVEQRAKLEWGEPEAFAGPLLDALIDIDALLRRIQNVTKLTPTQQAIQSWVWFAEGAATHDVAKLNLAGRHYETLPAHPLDLAQKVTRVGVEPATRCFALAGNWSAAKETARKWVAKAPEDADAHGRLAEAHYKLGEIPEAIQAYENYVRLRKESDNDWQSSLLLQLGLEAATRRTAAAALETAAFSASIRPQGERLIAWSCPWFDSLSRKAKERWWVGMFSLSSPHVATEMERERWDIAADSFGEAVAFELKERVFGPFAKSESLRPPDDYWKRVLAGRGTLREMIECLLQIRMRSNETAKQLASWLKTHHPRLFEHIQSPHSYRLVHMAKLRGDAQHGSVTEAETREVFKEAADLLKAITERTAG